MANDSLTSSQVNKAGRVMRRWWAADTPFGPTEIEALRVITRFRAMHAQPLIKANNGLRSMVRTEGCQVAVSQRLKRMATIIDKLERQPSMGLATMQDIGGCRAILANVDEVRRVQKADRPQPATRPSR